jgi:hypothetical protein
MYRRSSYVDRNRPYEIFVNSAHVGSISPATLVDFAVPCGELLLEARIDWGASHPLMIEASPGHRAEIEVSNNWGRTFSHWAMTFHPRGYLTLTQLPTVDIAATSRMQRGQAANGRRPTPHNENRARGGHTRILHACEGRHCRLGGFHVNHDLGGLHRRQRRAQRERDHDQAPDPDQHDAGPEADHAIAANIAQG